MRYSALGIAGEIGISKLAQTAGLSEEKAAELLARISEKTEQLPDTEQLKALDFALASMAVKIGVARHAGRIEKVYTPAGETWLQEGKDLSEVRKIIATGGSLIHAERIKEIAKCALYDPGDPGSLRPQRGEILLDKSYILSAMGLLSQYAPDIALQIMKEELVSYGITE